MASRTLSSGSTETTMAKRTSHRQAPQGGPQHPQDHADDGADRHRALPGGVQPRRRPRGRTPRSSPSWSADLLARRRRARRTRCWRRTSPSRAGRAAGADRPTAACAAATTPTSCALAAAARSRIADRAAATIAAARLRQEGHRLLPASTAGRWPSRPTRTSTTRPRFERGRAARRRAHRRASSRASSTGRRGLHAASDSAGRQRAGGRARCCRWSSGRRRGTASRTQRRRTVEYEFLPDAPEHPRRDLLPAPFKVRLFKCFLDAAVSEQIARMVAMKAATENADDMIKTLDAPVQPRPPAADHHGAARDHRRRRRAGVETSARHALQRRHDKHA